MHSVPIHERYSVIKGSKSAQTKMPVMRPVMYGERKVRSDAIHKRSTQPMQAKTDENGRWNQLRP